MKRSTIIDDALEHLRHEPYNPHELQAAPLAAWRQLCRTLAGKDYTATQAMFAYIAKTAPEVRSSTTHCAGHTLVAELVVNSIPVDELSCIDLMKKAVRGLLVMTAQAQLTGEQPAQQKLGVQMLQALTARTEKFSRRAVASPGLLLAVGRCMQQGFRAALSAVLEQWLAEDPDHREACMRCITDCLVQGGAAPSPSPSSSTAQQAPQEPSNSPEQLADRAAACSLLHTLLCAPQRLKSMAATGLMLTGAADSTQGLIRGVLDLLRDLKAHAALSGSAQRPAASASMNNNNNDSTDASAGSTRPRILRLKLSGKAAEPQDSSPVSVAAAAPPSPPPPLPSAAADGGPQPMEDRTHSLRLRLAEAGPSRAPEIPRQLLQPVASALMTLTLHDRCFVAEQLVASPGHLHTLLQLLAPAADQLSCGRQAAATLASCLCWAGVADMTKSGPFMQLFLHTPGALSAAGHLLQLAPAADGLQAVAALLQAAICSSTKSCSHLCVPQAGSDPCWPDSTSPSTGSLPRICVTCVSVTFACMAAAPGLVPMLVQRLHEPRHAGNAALVLDLLFSSCTPAQQRQLADASCINSLAQLLEHPSASPGEALTAPVAARLLLQLVTLHPEVALVSSQHAALPDDAAAPSDPPESLINKLLAAVCPGRAAVYAADALCAVAASPCCAEAFLSSPSAVQQLMGLLRAAQQESSWADLHTELAADYKHALSRLPELVCRLALAGGISTLEQQSPSAAHMLAAALRLHHPALPDAAAELAPHWPALQQALCPLGQQQQQWRCWQDKQQDSKLQAQQQHPQGLDLQLCGAREAAADVSLGVWGGSPVKPNLDDVEDTAASQQDKQDKQPEQEQQQQKEAAGAGAVDALVFVVPGSVWRPLVVAGADKDDAAQREGETAAGLPAQTHQAAAAASPRAAAVLVGSGQRAPPSPKRPAAFAPTESPPAKLPALLAGAPQD